MKRGRLYQLWLITLVICIAAASASAQSFRVQCPASTITHPNAGNNNSEPQYVGPTYTGTAGYPAAPAHVNGAIKCQQISGGDGYATMGDGTQTYMFSFGPLSGITDMANGLPGTEFPIVFNGLFPGDSATPPSPLVPGDPATTDGAGPGPNGPSTFGFNGAVGLAPEEVNLVTITDAVEGPLTAFAPATACSGSPANVPGTTVTVYTDAALGLPVGARVEVTIQPVTPVNPFNGTWTITCVNNNVINPSGFNGFAFTFTAPVAGLPAQTLITTLATASTLPQVDGHVDPRPIMDVGVMNGNIPAPLMAIDEDDEFFLTLTNVGMIMRPDLFEQHTVHFHGYPNASSFYDGVPDASVAINIGGSFTYYYLAPEAGTYFWHCHITPPEHLQMGMVGQIYVRPRQDRVISGGALYASLQTQQTDNRTKCDSTQDILCSNPLPAINTGATQPAAVHDAAITGTNGPRPGYAYNDGDGSTYYDVEYPIQIHGFDPNFHFVGMTFNPEGFKEMKDKYFLLNGRSYPDTVTTGPLATVSADGVLHYSQPLPSIITIPTGGRALLRISDLDVTEYQTLASLGIPMTVVGYNAKLLRDQAGNNLYYNTNSITLAGGESLDVILDACAVRASATSCTTPMPSGTYYLYTPNLDHLSNDAENFGGLMTEVHVN